jgi:hypothetical protein
MTPPLRQKLGVVIVEEGSRKKYTACPFVGYCGLFSINYFRKKNIKVLGLRAGSRER